MSKSFADTLKLIRTEQGLSQQQLADKLFVDRSSIANWESGRRIPNALLITRIAETLGVDIGTLMTSVNDEQEARPRVIVLDDEKIILRGEMATLEKVMPNALISGFTNTDDAITYAKSNNIRIIFSDIEMGDVNGIELSKEFLKINPRTNIIFLTAYADYSIDAWSTGASGFMVKPITEESLRKQLEHLRYPVSKLEN
ncbi:MAG: response regulator [Clostridiales bacterium]|jgi:transcriptional regulator with XRE-family HTH domain|nr:response regulator [Clostridiales bacterium]